MIRKPIPSIECILATLKFLDQVEVKPIHRLQELTGYSRSSLEITAFLLCKHGIVCSQRGNGGGYRLMKSREDLKIRDLIDFIPPSRSALAKAFIILSGMSVEGFIKASEG